MTETSKVPTEHCTVFAEYALNGIGELRKAHEGHKDDTDLELEYLVQEAREELDIWVADTSDTERSMRDDNTMRGTITGTINGAYISRGLPLGESLRFTFTWERRPGDTNTHIDYKAEAVSTDGVRELDRAVARRAFNISPQSGGDGETRWSMMWSSDKLDIAFRDSIDRCAYYGYHQITEKYSDGDEVARDEKLLALGRRVLTAFAEFGIECDDRYTTEDYFWCLMPE